MLVPIGHLPVEGVVSYIKDYTTTDSDSNNPQNILIEKVQGYGFLSTDAQNPLINITDESKKLRLFKNVL